MLILKTDLNALSKEKSLRQDFDFHLYRQYTERDSYPFNDLFEIVVSPKISLDDLQDNFFYCEIGDVDKEGFIVAQQLDKNERTLLNENYFSKIEKGDIISVEKGQMLLSKVRPNLKKYVRVTESNSYVYFTSAFINLKAKKIPVIMYYCLRKQFYIALMSVARQGKGYPTINEKDLVYLRFKKSIIDVLCAQEETITNQILTIESQIEHLYNQIVPTQRIIDEIFEKRFVYPADLLNRLHKGMSYGTQKAKNTELNAFYSSLGELSAKRPLRASTRSRNPLFDEFEILLKRIGTIKLNEVVTYIDNGVSPEYNVSGEVPVIKTANITIDGLNLENIEFVGEKQHEDEQKSQIQFGDILICNIGKCSLGKATINTLNDKMFAAAETMIVRVDSKKYNPIFLCYFLNSVLGVYQFEREYTGTTNQIHISPQIVKEFVLPNITPNEQEKIVNDIQAEIDKQTFIKNEILSLRNRIEEIIEQSIQLDTD